MKLDTNANPIWYREYFIHLENKSHPNSQYTQAINFRQTADGGFVICGRYFTLGQSDTLFPSGFQDAFLLKLDSHGCIINGCQLGTKSVSQQKLLIYPNPTSGTIRLRLNPPFSFQLINSLGGTVMSGESKTSNGLIQIPENTAEGVYFLKVEKSGSTFFNRMVLVR
jgi:hypothetical protein